MFASKFPAVSNSIDACPASSYRGNHRQAAVHGSHSAAKNIARFMRALFNRIVSTQQRGQAMEQTTESFRDINSNRYLHLDGWRGLSILAVLIGHFFPLAGINFGRFGVEMFFVLSGRLMGEILFVNKTALPKFFKRRISRVWPALFVFVCLAWATLSFWTGRLHVGAISAISCLTFTYNYAQLVIGRSPILDHIWSLCIEEHIYLLLGLVAYVSRKHSLDPIKFLGILTLVFMANGALQSAYFGLDYNTVYWRTDARGASILVAVVIYLTLKEKSVSVPPWVSPTFLVFGLLLNADAVPDALKYSLGTTCLAISICSVRLESLLTMKLMKNPLLIWIGLISYSLYLWQQPFYELIGQNAIERRLGSLSLVALLLAAVICACGSYFLIEGPARRFLNERWTKQSSAPVPVGL
jgi:peptidoglycan/LPS O-acetylase OafA/YrhL